MKSICYDVHHAIAGRWFFAALIATTVALYLSVGQANLWADRVSGEL